MNELAEKCEFHKSTIVFLGYVISQQGVKKDKDKVWAVTEWPTPSSIKKLQRFLGFSNFYRCFIRGYSTVASLLTALLCGKRKWLCWSDSAQATFKHLKHCFTLAPILHHLDPSILFVVGVDASNCGIEAVLSQCHGNPVDLHLDPRTGPLKKTPGGVPDHLLLTTRGNPCQSSDHFLVK
ncbi:hypothetical protein QTP70_014499, partial [Hemibagrus guttatus]